MNLLTIIVNIRLAALTKKALASVFPSLCALPSSHVMVVDDDSEDNFVPELSAFLASESHFSGRVTIHPEPKNGGWGYGNNEGIRPWLNS